MIISRIKTKKKKWWNVRSIAPTNRGCLRILECGIKGFENWGTAEEGAVDKETEGVIGDWEREGNKTYCIPTNFIFHPIATRNELSPEWDRRNFGDHIVFRGGSVVSYRISLLSRRNFGERVLSNFITKIMAAIFNFNDSGRLGREINLYQGGVRRSKVRRGVRGVRWRLVSPFPLPLPPPSTLIANQTWLVG